MGEIVRLADRLCAAEVATWREPAPPTRRPMPPVTRPAPQLRAGTVLILPLAAEPVSTPGVQPMAQTQVPSILLWRDIALGLVGLVLLAGLAAAMVGCFVLLWKATAP